MPVAKRCASRGILSWPMSLSFGWGGDVATIYTPYTPKPGGAPRFSYERRSALQAGRDERGLAAAALHRVRGVRLDLERADGFRSGHARGRVPALLDVVVGDDLVLLLAAEAGVLGQRVAEARGQPVIVAAEALAQVEEPGEGDPEVDGGRGHAVDDDRVPARALELGAPVTAGLRLAEGAGERRLGADAVATRAWHRGAGDHAGREDQDVVRPEGVRTTRDVFEQVVGD